MFISGTLYLSLVIALEIVRAKGGVLVLFGDKPRAAVVAPDRRSEQSTDVIRITPEGKERPAASQTVGSEDIDVANERLRILSSDANESPVVIRGLRKVTGSIFHHDCSFRYTISLQKLQFSHCFLKYREANVSVFLV